MDILEKLEQRILALVERQESLKAENAALKREMDELRAKERENSHNLEAALAEERALKNDAVRRIDSILQLLEAQDV